jgi:hypothetical protein
MSQTTEDNKMSQTTEDIFEKLQYDSQRQLPTVIEMSVGSVNNVMRPSFVLDATQDPSLVQADEKYIRKRYQDPIIIYANNPKGYGITKAAGFEQK